MPFSVPAGGGCHAIKISCEPTLRAAVITGAADGADKNTKIFKVMDLRKVHFTASYITIPSIKNTTKKFLTTTVCVAYHVEP